MKAMFYIACLILCLLAWFLFFLSPWIIVAAALGLFWAATIVRGAVLALFGVSGGTSATADGSLGNDGGRTARPPEINQACPTHTFHFDSPEHEQRTRRQILQRILKKL